MNAYKNYKKRELDKAMYQVAMDNCDAYIEHMYLIILDVLHTDFGFGAERDDTWALKRNLRAIGFDYDAVVAEIVGGDENHE